MNIHYKYNAGVDADLISKCIVEFVEKIISKIIKLINKNITASLSDTSNTISDLNQKLYIVEK